MNTNQYSQAFQTQLGTQGHPMSSSDYYGQGAAGGVLSDLQDFGSSQDHSYLQFTEFSQVRWPSTSRACRAAPTRAAARPGTAHSPRRDGLKAEG